MESCGWYQTVMAAAPGHAAVDVFNATRRPLIM